MNLSDTGPLKKKEKKKVVPVATIAVIFCLSTEPDKRNTHEAVFI